MNVLTEYKTPVLFLTIQITLAVLAWRPRPTTRTAETNCWTARTRSAGTTWWRATATTGVRTPPRPRTTRGERTGKFLRLRQPLLLPLIFSRKKTRFEKTTTVLPHVRKNFALVHFLQVFFFFSFSARETPDKGGRWQALKGLLWKKVSYAGHALWGPKRRVRALSINCLWLTLLWILSTRGTLTSGQERNWLDMTPLPNFWNVIVTFGTHNSKAEHLRPTLYVDYVQHL